ncbi:hypothetical protein K8942_03010 [Candidatus Peribacteria bacterium]|nr:MAG: hypothetical protein K8942_03010 [Candidatus Peribacteria bacterium]
MKNKKADRQFCKDETGTASYLYTYFLPLFPMAENESSSSTMIVALVAILVIVALGFLLYKQLPNAGAPASNSGIDVDVDLPGGNTPNP